ncbi:hypothetical protein FV233_04800 [Methylobacterium sp. WL7]|nr:hypothetical protein FV233_04800 [Methylobacterium sp. WL7]
MALAVLASPVLADTPRPAPGLYCPVGGEAAMPISVQPGGGMGIDGLDCSTVDLAGGRARSGACYANGGSIVDLDVDLVVRPDGDLVHNGIRFRRHPGRPPCP